jgi:hypothetical protein
MSTRLNQEREKELQPRRTEYAVEKLKEKNKEVRIISETEIQFEHLGHTVRVFPYSGWHSGKTIRDGRGINRLLKQL